jgi:hypothetical protein
VASWLGYDPRAVAALSAGHARALAAVALSALPGLALTMLAAGHGAYLASGLLPLGVAVGVGAGLYLFNLLRLSVAGGGVAPHQPAREIRAWSPRVVPLVMLAVVGVFLAQPLLLWGLRARHDPTIAVLRTSLRSLHEAAVLGPVQRALADETRRATALEQRRTRLAATLALAVQDRLGVEDAQAALATADGEVATVKAGLEALRTEQRTLETKELAVYAAHLERSHFLLRRLQLTWADPWMTLTGSVLMLVLLVLPWVTSGVVVRAQRAYELQRWAATRALVEVAWARACELETSALKAWPTFTQPRLPLFTDAPWNQLRRKAGPRHG